MQGGRDVTEAARSVVAQADVAGDSDLFGADAAERDADNTAAVDTGDGGAWDEGEVVTEDELMESGDDEEETALLGGGGFSTEQLQQAEAHWEHELVRIMIQLCPYACFIHSLLRSLPWLWRS